MDRIKKIVLLTLGAMVVATGFVIASSSLRAGVAWGPIIVSNATFVDGGVLPAANTCDGANVSPALTVDDAPAGTQSLMLDLIDPSNTKQEVSWIVWNISPDVAEIPADVKPDVGVIGVNSFGKNNYTGPCPKMGTTQHYRYEAYALDTILDLPATATYAQVQKATKNHVIGYGSFTLSYSR